MSDVILSIENVSKEYQLGTFSAGTFSGDLQRWWYKIRRKEDPFKKIGTNDRSKKTDDEFVLALEDINFEVKRGEVLGIIGKNGAGKSTLLKLLSRVTSPTVGRIRSAGRMASLLEVGTGFHPELTGMENIFLNGAILGMNKAEIKGKLDEIIEFSGCTQYIDTPVKRYSSGMRVRLGFAVAAFLDPEILVVDEVLAVGDAEFQKKAIGKMKDVSEGEGRTVLFVSHNMDSIKALCTRALILENGRIIYNGSTEEAIAKYLDVNEGKDNLLSSTISKEYIRKKADGKIDSVSSFLEIDCISILDEQNNTRTEFNSNEKVRIKIEFQIQFLTSDLRLIVSIINNQGEKIINTQLSDSFENTTLKPDTYATICEFPENMFGTNEYLFSVEFISPKKEHYKLNGIGSFRVKYINERYTYASAEKCFVRPKLDWYLTTNENVNEEH